MKKANSTLSNFAGIYIHIPFCKSKCIYCDFYSVPNKVKEIPNFTSSLLSEIELFSNQNHIDWNFDTIYFGGGTPSLLHQNEIELILEKLHDCFNLTKLKEITIEVNPGEISFEKLQDFRKLGINRISIGCQSFDENILKFLNRIHSPLECITTFHLARDVGFENISLDLIYNIPKQTVKEWQNELEIAIDLSPEHISAYALTIEKNTPLHDMIHRQNAISKPSDDICAEMFSLTHDILDAKLYSGYEISNFAKHHKECKHNLHYWNLDRYLGFGPSAHSYDGNNRWWNVNSLDKYRSSLQNLQLPISETEILSKSDKYNELILNGLRLQKGISMRVIDKLHSSELIKATFNKWDNYLFIEDGYLRLTPKGRLFTDEISAELFC